MMFSTNRVKLWSKDTFCGMWSKSTRHRSGGKESENQKEDTNTFRFQRFNLQVEDRLQKLKHDFLDTTTNVLLPSPIRSWSYDPTCTNTITLNQGWGFLNHPCDHVSRGRCLRGKYSFMKLTKLWMKCIVNNWMACIVEQQPQLPLLKKIISVHPSISKATKWTCQREIF